MMYSFKKIFASSVFGATLLLSGCGAEPETSGQEGAQNLASLNEIIDALQGLVSADGAGQTINVDTTGDDIVITIPRVPASETNPDGEPAPPVETYIVAVTDSNNDGHLPLWTLDSNLADDSRWSAQPANNNSPWIEYELSNAISVDSLQIVFYQGNSVATTFQIETSIDGSEWDVALLETSSGTAEAYESFVFEARSAKYVRLVGFGNNSSPWTSVLEVSIPGVTLTDSIAIPPVTPIVPEVPAPPVNTTPVTILSVTDSNNDGHLPELTLDGSLTDESRWSANLLSGQTYSWIQYKLDRNIEISSIGIAFFKGDVRKTKFDVFASLNGTDWTLVHSTSSSGSASGVETFNFEKVIASHVRIQGYGNSSNTWTSIIEVNIPNVDKSSWE